MHVSRSPESLLIRRAPPSHNLGEGGKELSEPMRRGAERTTPRDFPVKPLNWHNQVFFATRRCHCRFFCSTSKMPQPLGHRAGPPVASSINRQRIISKHLRRLLGYSLQRNIPHRARLPPGPSGLVIKGDRQSNVQRVRMSVPA